MTNEELLADLKQFIEATISQQMSQFATKEDLASIEQRMATKDDIKALGERIDRLDDKLDTIQEGIAEVVEDHEKRITRLEEARA